MAAVRAPSVGLLLVVSWRHLMSLGFEFSTVRVLCHDCGWYRNIGYSGIKDNVRPSYESASQEIRVTFFMGVF